MQDCRILDAGALAALSWFGLFTVVPCSAAQPSTPSEVDSLAAAQASSDAGGPTGGTPQEPADSVVVGDSGSSSSLPEGARADDVPAARTCSVSLSRLSADDPGADDGEFLELRIERDGDDSACRLPMVTLLNGAGGGCEPYRSLDLRDQEITTQRFVVICASASTVDADVTCDVTQVAGKSLPNGWLQNGPDDAIAILDESGEVVLAYHYGATGNGCSGELAGTWLPSEEGEIDGDDDVIVACGDDFELMRLAESPLRGEPRCERPPPDTGQADADTQAPTCSDLPNATQPSATQPGATQPGANPQPAATAQPTATAGTSATLPSDATDPSIANGIDAGIPPSAPRWGHILDGSVTNVGEPRFTDAASVERPASGSTSAERGMPPQVGCVVRASGDAGALARSKLWFGILLVLIGATARRRSDR